jgi:MerR HTH family regulatory protein
MKLPGPAARRLLDSVAVEKLRLAHENFPLISIQAVSAEYGIPIRTLRRWQVQGKMPDQVKHGRRLMYKKAGVEVFISRTRCPEEP